MLTLTQKRQQGAGIKFFSVLVAILLVVGGLYVLALVMAPNFPQIALKPITPEALAAPTEKTDRIIIPKIGVNIPYGTNGDVSLNAGALWRHPDRGNPAEGGNFIIAAHRFSLQPTPWDTIEKSPFYNIDKIKPGDQILIDYDGKRYAFEASEFKDVPPTAIEIEAESEEPKLTLYSCTLAGSADGRVVIIAKPIGEVAV